MGCTHVLLNAHLKTRKKLSLSNFIFCLYFDTSLRIKLAGLIIMAWHQTFSSQIKYLSGQIKFGQTKLLYIINGEVIEFAEDNECPDNI